MGGIVTGVFFTADSHFRHARVAEIRGHAVEEHDELLIELWNKAVTPRDEVWHLGDVTIKSFQEVKPLLQRLNGTIHLITGNHDSCWPGHRQSHRHQREWLEVFASVQAYARRRVGKRQVMLSHLPYAGGGDHTETERHAEFRLRDNGSWLLHGHVHDAWRQRGRMINVGVDVWDMAPVSWSKLIDRIEAGDS